MLLSGYLDKLTSIFEKPYLYHPGYHGLPFEVTYTDPLTSAEDIEQKTQEFERQVALDWPRRIEHRYRLAGVPIKQLDESNQAEYISPKGLFLTQLAIGVEPKYREEFVNKAILHCHQGGLIHNTGAVLSQMYQANRMAQFNDKANKQEVAALHFLGDVTFYPIHDGIGILEKNKLTQIITMKKQDEDTVENFAFDQMSPVEILTYSTLTFDPKTQALIISKPHVQTVIKEDRMYDLMGIQKTSKALSERVWDKGAEAATHVKHFAAKVKGNMAKSVVAWIGSKSKQAESAIEEVNTQTEVDKLKGQLSARLIMLQEKIEDQICLAESIGTLLEDRHGFYLKGIQRACEIDSKYDELLKAPFQTDVAFKRKEAQITLPQKWKQLTQTERVWAREKITDLDEKLVKLRDQLSKLELEFTSMQAAEQASLKEKFKQKSQRLTQKITLHSRNKERLIRFNQVLPKESLFQNPFSKSIVSLNKAKLGQVIAKQTALCQQYDITALSMFQTLRKLSVVTRECEALQLSVRKQRESIDGYTDHAELNELIKRVDAHILQYDLGRQFLIKGKESVESNLHTMEKLLDLLDSMEEKKEKMFDLFSNLMTMSSVSVEKNETTFYELPKRPTLIDITQLPFWHHKDVQQFPSFAHDKKQSLAV